jgi:predicted transcriptional regulator
MRRTGIDESRRGEWKMADTIDAKQNAARMTAEIVAAYVSKNAVSQAELPKLIGEVHRALSGVLGQSAPREEQKDPKPPVSIKKSITQDYLICLEDGKKFKSLKRHLRSHYNMSPEQYREKWGLVADYPMVAPNYAQARSSLAKSMGLGRRKGRT